MINNLNKNYRPEIDGLRAISVLAVLIFHLNIIIFDKIFLSGGFLGVDVFFVISGYLITNILLKEISKNNFKITSFFERRIRRIIPALFFMIICLSLISYLMFFPNDFASYANSVIANSLFISNFFFWFHNSDYFSADLAFQPLLHTWSLSVEEQFYIIFPLFLVAGFKFFKNKIVLILVIFFFASLFLDIYANALFVKYFFIKGKAYSQFYLPTSRAWEILLGVFCSFYTFKYNTNIKKQFRNLIVLAGLCMILLSLIFVEGSENFSNKVILISTLGTCMILIFTNQDTILFKFLSNKLLVLTGKISYSVYLWHFPIIVVFNHYFLSTEHDLFIKFIIFSMSLIFGYFSWKYIETPFRKKHFLKTSTVFIITASLILVFILGAKYITKNYGLPDRFNSNFSLEKWGHKYFKDQLKNNYFECNSNLMPEKLYNSQHYRCVTSKNSSEIDIIIFGDSHSEHFFPGLANQFENKNVMLLALSSKPYLDNVDYKLFFNFLFNQDGNDKLVIPTFSYAGRVYEDTTDEFYEKWNKLIKKLKKYNYDILLLEGVPHFKEKVNSCFYDRVIDYYDYTLQNCKITTNFHSEQKKVYFDNLKKISVENNIMLIELTDDFCDEVYCKNYVGKKLLYRDTTHLSLFGSNYIIKKIKQKILTNN